MKVGITTRFLNSYFSGGIPQVSCNLAKTLQLGGHTVTLLYPEGEPDWFIDVKKLADTLPPRKPWSPSSTDRYDMVIEVVWFLPEDAREKIADHRILWAHQPPIFHDIESSVYPWNATQRSFKNITAVMTYDTYSKQDIRYLEFLSGVQVIQIPFLWNPDALDFFRLEANLPDWKSSAKRVESIIAKDAHPSVSWSVRVVESNFSNTSHCNVPLNIVTQIRVQGDPVRVNVHNAELLTKNDFFNTNIVKNLLLPDISGALVPRVRLPDLLNDKTVIISHQRFRPLKMFMLDALYLGIPLIHNCELLTNLGAPYGYKLNQIIDATNNWKKLKKDYETNKGIFDVKVHNAIKVKLTQTFSPTFLVNRYVAAMEKAVTPKAILVAPLIPKNTKELRVHFCELWSDFVPKYNFFMYLLSWIGATNNIPVILDSQTPNLVVYGPLSKGQEKAYPGVSKLWFTGENTTPPNDPDIVLSLGFQYSTSPNYIRLPLWMLEINWFGANPDKIVNPRPVSVEAATTVDNAILEKKSKFCAFVVTNPSNQNRNISFQVLDKWRSVDSAGRLYCNRKGGPLPGGLGGGGGELAKVEFYKDYKFALTYENSAGAGYTTEKLFHAKVAGAVPIYWGDPFVDRDFDSAGFLNANQISKPEDLIALVQKVADNSELWHKMASVPALSATKKIQCEQTMEEVGKRLFKLIIDVNVSVDSWVKAGTFGNLYETMNISAYKPVQTTASATATLTATATATPTTTPTANPTASPRIFVTAANARYIEAVINVVASVKSYERTIASIVYVWNDVTQDMKDLLLQHGATEVRNFPETHGPWKDFWNPQHFAWKLWLHIDASNKAEHGTSILYLDAGIVIATHMTKIWDAIMTNDIFLINDDEQINERWCHPTFCKEFQVTDDELKANQILGGCIGYKVGGKYATSVFRSAIAVAEAKPEVIVGEKWSPYSQVCLGHRHDQSILSILTQRAGAPRLPIKEMYCDRSLRAAQQWGTPLYVHRGNFKSIVPFTEGIDEAYVINLERRSDRLEKFKQTHKNIKDRVYLWKATDGRALTLNPEIVHCFRDNDFKWKKSVMGCALSHLGLWEKLANDKLAKSYLIMEDDVVLNDRWILRWMASAKDIPADTDVVYLGGILPPNKSVFPQVAEHVNDHFGRIAKNTLYSSNPRRYFHFCNYAYVLTQQGARKLINLVKEKGIFTSGDHMIVNHGDDLLNIYFTTPLLASCFQENDPVYQKSDFNNFNRVDNFDSDLWNNTECFSKDEVFEVLSADLQKQKFSVVGEPVPSVNPPTEPIQPEVTKFEFSAVWNQLLQTVALKNDKVFLPILRDMIVIWTLLAEKEAETVAAYHGMFEQLVVSENDMFMRYKNDIYNMLSAGFDLTNTALWGRIVEKLAPQRVIQSPVPVLNPTKPPIIRSDSTPVFYLKTINTNFFEETDWLNSIFPKQIQWVELQSYDDLVKAINPILLFQNIPGEESLAPIYNGFVKGFEKLGKTLTILHLSDEFSTDPVDFYQSPAVKRVVRNYARPGLPMDKVEYIPLGYAKGRQGTTEPTPTFSERKYIWSFAGSMDRNGRDSALQALKRTGDCLIADRARWSDEPKMNAEAYKAMLRDSKFVPCFKGSFALESYRLYEALEQGAIPVYVPEGTDTYVDVLDKNPILSFPSWDKVAELLPVLAQNTQVMEEHRQSLQTWWVSKKAEVKAKLQSL